MKNLLKGILLIPRSAKKPIIVAVDSLLLVGAIWLSFSLRLDNWYWPRGGLDNPIALLVLISLGLIVAVPVALAPSSQRADALEHAHSRAHALLYAV